MKKIIPLILTVCWIALGFRAYKTYQRREGRKKKVVSETEVIEDEEKALGIGGAG